MSCPKCGSNRVSGLVASFWVGLDVEGQIEGEMVDVRSETELTEKRSCRKCHHEWEDGIEEESSEGLK
jgi:hypothetical protein